MAGTSENLIAAAIIQYLETRPDHSATIAQIRSALPGFIELTREDREPSLTRTGEQKWEQIVRNVVCHRDVPDNAVNDGLLVYVARGRLSLPGLE
ncbi:hypothetical protein Tasa_033_013 [Tanticharoenia sakaeratensis NBRC 103193]|uniref:Uncharacterized protein n=1 Tax=Tanticharoenia sakaeratensis NBRC 103193 TaxID=1231623 RepID=A0A0D6MMK4_9PROT|nr:hypothetical protein Tasa_033_013 [Tanticharoenia sakaeratensis NBRC 103193]